MSFDSPLISILIPAFNCEKYVAETIACLLNQSYKNIEIIVVDDGSTDNTLHVLSQVNDARLKYSVQANKGASAARNAAFANSSGEFIKFMDSDDLISPNCLEVQLKKIINQPGCIASATWGRFYREDGSDFKPAPETVWKDLPGIDWLINSLIDSGANMMQPGIFLVPRNIIEKAGAWNETLSLIDDFDYMIRVISNTSSVLFCEDSLLMYRSGISISLSGKKSAKHMQSAWESLNLGVAQILNVQNDVRSRLACANTYQHWAFQFFPYHRALYFKAAQKVKELGGSNIRLRGGKLYKILSMIIGWKNAIRLKMFLKKPVG